MTCYNKSVIPLGVLPNGVLPVCKCPSSTFLYYREDGDLYFYDCDTIHETNLFNLSGEVPPIPPITTASFYFGFAPLTTLKANLPALLRKHTLAINASVSDTFDGTVTPIVNYGAIIVPNGRDITVLQNGFPLRANYTLQDTVVIDGITYSIFRDNVLSTIEVVSTFNLTLI